jgi:hypothetical protein
MLGDKRGLSTVVTTLIIILLVLVAIGIIWVVVNNVITEGSEEVDYSVKCLEVDVKATSVANCGMASCDLTLKRGAGGEDIAGVKVVFSNSTSGSSDVIDYAGNIDELQTITPTITITGLTNNPDKVEVTPYFTDSSGVERYCTTATYNF